MSKIDVSKCKFYEFDGICGSPINKKELECQKITNEMCSYKQLQQYKHCLDEIFDLLTACKSNLDKGKTCKKCKYINQCTVIDTDSWILQKIKETRGDR